MICQWPQLSAVKASFLFSGGKLTQSNINTHYVQAGVHGGDVDAEGLAWLSLKYFLPSSQPSTWRTSLKSNEHVDGALRPEDVHAAAITW